jgi:GT2 family glycosyltransferase
MARSQRISKSERKVTPASINLCVLAGTGSDADIKTSLSCLREQPGAAVTLIKPNGRHSLSRVKKFIEIRYGSTVSVINASAAGRFGSECTESEELSCYIFIPGGDWLSDNALYKIASAVCGKGAEIVYTDQDLINKKGHLEQPRFKAEPCYEYLAHSDYIGDLFCVRQSTLAQYGGIDLSDYYRDRYALLLRAFSDRKCIYHIPEPIYHARHRSGARDLAPILRNHFKNEIPPVEVLPVDANVYRIKRRIPGTPKATILIPFKDKPGLLKQCLHSILDNTQYSNYEILGISNRSQSTSVYATMEEFSGMDPRIRFTEYNIPFNFSALVNYGVRKASGEYIVLMNNDISVLDPGWLGAMLEHGQRPEVGVVGAKLLYPDGSIQHGGLSVQKSGYVGHLHKHYPADSRGYMNRLICVHEVSAVTAALCLFKKELHRQLQGFDEERFGLAFNDVDFCLRAEALGYSNIFTPFALACHHESLSRGYEIKEYQKLRFNREHTAFWELYRERRGRADPRYNPNFDQYRDDFSY